MSCKKIHKKLIFFLEKELPDSEIKLVQEHLDVCSECSLFAQEMQLSLKVVDGDKIKTDVPFFYTRVKARLRKEEKKENFIGFALTRILQPVAFSFILLLGIYGGFKLGEPLSKQQGNRAENESQMVMYLNDMNAEPIETFLTK